MCSALTARGENILTIEDRLCFIRAGYSAQDIARFEAAETAAEPAQAAEPAPATDPAPAPAPAEDPAPAPAPAPAWAVALNNTLSDLRKAIQDGNARYDDMGDDTDVHDAADAALQQYITGKGPEKSHGGKRK